MVIITVYESIIDIGIRAAHLIDFGSLFYDRLLLFIIIDCESTIVISIIHNMYNELLLFYYVELTVILIDKAARLNEKMQYCVR